MRERRKTEITACDHALKNTTKANSTCIYFYSKHKIAKLIYINLLN